MEPNHILFTETLRSSLVANFAIGAVKVAVARLTIGESVVSWLAAIARSSVNVVFAPRDRKRCCAVVIKNKNVYLRASSIQQITLQGTVDTQWVAAALLATNQRVISEG